MHCGRYRLRLSGDALESHPARGAEAPRLEPALPESIVDLGDADPGVATGVLVDYTEPGGAA